MKKSIYSLSILCLLFVIMLLTGCVISNKTTSSSTTTKKDEITTTLEDKTTTKEDVTTSKDDTTTEAQKTKLSAPVVTVDDAGLATWNAIENASGYAYNLNGTERATNKTSYQLADGDKFKVMALGDNNQYLDSDYSNEVTYTAPVVEVTGIPEPNEGFYMKEPDLLQDGNKRYLLYTTNKTVAEDDPVLAIRVAELNEDNAWIYGEETIVVEGSTDGWDKYISSGSLTKGTFAMGGETYNYLIAYAATAEETNVCNQIGLAAAKEVTGPYVKVGTEPVIKYDKEVYGANMVGCYAPSLVNYDKASGIRIFYTYADAYGHFAYFFDADMSNLSTIKGAKAMITNEGDIQGGDAVTMFPNADFLYDEDNNIFVCVKDYSPSPAIKPSFANEFEVLWIPEVELYTTDKGDGWKSMVYMDYLELDIDYERCYSCSLVSDVYGHVIREVGEVVYTTCEEGDNYMFTQKLLTYYIDVEN